MWFFPTKKEIKKEFEKIKDSFTKRDLKIDSHDKELNNINTKIAKLEGIISVLMSQKSMSQSHPVSYSLKKSQSNFETRLINKVRKSKKALIMTEIKKLEGINTTSEMFNIIVNEKGLCSKASFYRYIAESQSIKVSNS